MVLNEFIIDPPYDAVRSVRQAGNSSSSEGLDRVIKVVRALFMNIYFYNDVFLLSHFSFNVAGRRAKKAEAVSQYMHVKLGYISIDCTNLEIITDLATTN